MEKATKSERILILMIGAFLIIGFVIVYPNDVPAVLIKGALLGIIVAGLGFVYDKAKQKWPQIQPKLLDAMPILIKNQKKG